MLAAVPPATGSVLSMLRTATSLSRSSSSGGFATPTPSPSPCSSTGSQPSSSPVSSSSGSSSCTSAGVDNYASGFMEPIDETHIVESLDGFRLGACASPVPPAEPVPTTGTKSRSWQLAMLVNDALKVLGYDRADWGIISLIFDSTIASEDKWLKKQSYDLLAAAIVLAGCRCGQHHELSEKLALPIDAPSSRIRDLSTHVLACYNSAARRHLYVFK